MNGTWMDRLRQVDRQRASFPGEHWLVATAGMWFLRRKGLLGKVAGAALLYRAASGREDSLACFAEEEVPAGPRRGGAAAAPPRKTMKTFGSVARARILGTRSLGLRYAR